MEESGRGLFWPVAIVGMLLGHAALLTGAAALATALIPNALVTPTGYEDGLRWDDRQAERAASARLGWTIEVVPSLMTHSSTVGARPGAGGVSCVLRDAQGGGLDGATVRVKMNHHSRPRDVAVLSLAAGGGGVYSAPCPALREGLWRMEVVAERDADRFVTVTDFWAPRPGALR